MIRRFKTFILCGFSLLLCGSVVSAEEANPLSSFTQDLTRFSANFTQQLYDESHMLLEENSGQMQIQRPGKFRWEYQVPYQQLIVADGEHIWIYEADLAQVTVKPQDMINNTPAMLLSGNAELMEQFSQQVLPAQDGLNIVQLTPKDEHAQFQSIQVRFQQQQLHSLELRDKLGQITLLQFSEQQRNPEIPAQNFTFSPPAGVDVIDGAS